MREGGETEGRRRGQQIEPVRRRRASKAHYFTERGRGDFTPPRLGSSPLEGRM